MLFLLALAVWQGVAEVCPNSRIIAWRAFSTERLAGKTARFEQQTAKPQL
jgi:hypothetical protein